MFLGQTDAHFFMGQALMQLSAEAYLAIVGDCSVLLDLREDKYRLLGARLTQVVIDALGGSPDEHHGVSVRSELVARGVIPEAYQPTATDQARVKFESTAEATLWPTRRYGLGLGSAPRLSLSALRALLETRSLLRKRSFLETVEHLRRKRGGLREREKPIERQDLLDSFFAARPWFPTEPICRLDAPAMCLHFWRHGIDARLVFGVRVRPFGAHCWAQLGTLALSEPHRKLQQYTPILVV
ncbi:hypothetical protein CAF53_02335 [Sphingobium sp. LB126]|nr:hypothetical protein CAF53_02335 [Sphingobium sp. LB126]